MIPQSTPVADRSPPSQVGIAWTVLTTVLFVFPPETPVTPDNMNYCIAAFGVMLLIAGATWFADGRKHYTGPQIDVDGLLNGKVEGMEPVPTTKDAAPETVEKA